MTIAITGASGFVGSHLIPLLNAHNDVHIITLDICEGIDICDWNQIKDIKADLIIHLANKSYVPDSYEHPEAFYRVNINGTLNMLELARINHARMIYFSSYVYGTPEYLPIDENHPIRAFNPYATTKVMCEEMCQGYARDFKVPVCVFRPFNIYGKGQSPNFLISMIAEQVKTDRVQVRDDRPKRDYIHINDIVSAVDYMAFCEWPTTYAVYNLGSGESHSVKEVAQEMIRLTRRPIQYVATGETRPNEVLDTVADITKLRALGWKPKVSLAEGLMEMISE